MRQVQTEIAVTTVVDHPSGFISIADASERLRDDMYIYGAIRLWVGDEPILTSSDWTLVDQLWDYLVDARTQMERRQRFHTHFPDRPTTLEIVPKGVGALRVTATCGAESQTALAHRDIFFQHLWSAAREFYAWLPSVAPTMQGHCYRQLRALSG